MGFTIRYAHYEDVDALGAIYSQSYQTAFKGIIPDRILEDVFSYGRRREGLQNEMQEGTTVNVIMLDEDKPMGMLTYGKSKDEDLNYSCAEILRIYLLPEYWGQRAGEVLIDWVLKKMEQEGYKNITLWVIEDNIRARKFYERIGFVHDGKTRAINVGRELRDYRYIKYL